MLEDVVIGEADAFCVSLSTLGEDIDYSIYTFVPIDGNGCCVLEYLYLVNLFGRETCNVSFDAIDKDEWCIVTIEGL